MQNIHHTLSTDHIVFLAPRFFQPPENEEQSVNFPKQQNIQNEIPPKK